MINKNITHIIHPNERETISIKLENPGTTEPLQIPATCTSCGFPNFKIHGVKQNHTLTIKVKCMRCGKPHKKITHT